MNIVQNLILYNICKIYKKEIVIIDRIKNKRRLKIYKSFNFKKIIYLIDIDSVVNFFKDYRKFFHSLKNINNINQFINLRHENIEIGKISYDDYLRNSFAGTSNELKFKLYFHLFKCFSIYRILKKN